MFLKNFKTARIHGIFSKVMNKRTIKGLFLEISDIDVLAIMVPKKTLLVI